MESKGSESPKAKKYRTTDHQAISNFIAINNSGQYKRNVLFVANGEFLEGPRKKSNLKAARFVQVDVDAKDFIDDDESLSVGIERVLDLFTETKAKPRNVPEPTFAWIMRLTDPTMALLNTTRRF